MKPLIGITQRVEVVTAYKERRDCLDQNWIHLVDNLGFVGIPLPNVCENPGEYLDTLSLNGVILSGGNSLAVLGDGPGTAPERDNFERNILDWARSRSLPVLGVCRGFQMLNWYLGGRMITVQEHVARRHIVRAIHADKLFMPYSDVNSFHNYGIGLDTLADELKPLLTCEDGTIEAARHRSLPWVGIMWHPERETPFQETDKELLCFLFTPN